MTPRDLAPTPPLDVAAMPKARDDLVCPECGARLVLKPSRFRPFYGCETWARTNCRGSVGAHPDGAPMGTPADLATKAARSDAHLAFDPLWQSGLMTRKDAYRWLQQVLGLTDAEAHIGHFDIATCRRLIGAVRTVTRGRQLGGA